jgi:hypothetical protein
MGRIIPYIIMENNNHVPNHQPGKDGKSPWYFFNSTRNWKYMGHV